MKKFLLTLLVIGFSQGGASAESKSLAKSLKPFNKNSCKAYKYDSKDKKIIKEAWWYADTDKNMNRTSGFKCANSEFKDFNYSHDSEEGDSGDIVNEIFCAQALLIKAWQTSESNGLTYFDLNNCSVIAEGNLAADSPNKNLFALFEQANQVSDGPNTGLLNILDCSAGACKKAFTHKFELQEIKTMSWNDNTRLTIEFINREILALRPDQQDELYKAKKIKSHCEVSIGNPSKLDCK